MKKVCVLKVCMMKVGEGEGRQTQSFQQPKQWRAEDLCTAGGEARSG